MQYKSRSRAGGFLLAFLLSCCRSFIFSGLPFLAAGTTPGGTRTPTPTPKSGRGPNRNFIARQKILQFFTGMYNTQQLMTMTPEKLNTQTGHPLAPGATLTPTETWVPPEPTPEVTMRQLNDVVNSMSFSNYKNMKNNSPGLLNIAPNMISGYGNKPMDFYSKYGSPTEAFAKDPAGENYDTVYWNMEDNDFSGPGSPSILSWVDNNIGSEADADYAAQIFNMMAAVNDYDRYRNLQNMAQKNRNDNLYGSVLADLLENVKAQQSPIPLSERRYERPLARQRNITGTYDWEEGGAFIPEQGDIPLINLQSYGR